MAKNKKKNKGGAANAPGAKSQASPKSTVTNQPTPKKTKNIADQLKLGKISSLDNALTRVRELAEERGVDYIGVLKDPNFFPTSVYPTEDESVRVVLARLGALKQETVKEAPKVDEKNVNTGAPKKAKAAPEVDEFIKRPRPTYVEETIEVPRGFAAEFVIGRGSNPTTENDPLLNSRMGWKYGAPQTLGNYIMTLDGAKVGLLSTLRLDDVFDRATKGLKKDEKLPISGEQFAECLSIVKAYIENNDRIKSDSTRPILVQDFFEILELDYRELMVPQASEFAKTVKLACEYDIAETARLAKRWKKIKKYRHKVPLAYSEDRLGIFSDNDVGILNSLGIKVLNQIKAHNVIELKNLLLEKDFARIIEEINGAFKEDRERRFDARYKTYPFAFTTISLLFAIIVAFNYQYALIKDSIGASILNNAFAVWGFGLLIMFMGIIRTPFRKKKHASYCYFTKKVRRKTRHLVELSIFAIALSFIFFQRYDGYNTEVYYRFVDDETIAVAGLVDDETENLIIPDTIDGREIVSIMPLAFKGDEYLASITIPTSVETIGKYAFSGCTKLETVVATNGASGVKTIEKNAFEDCYSLKGTQILASVESVGKDAFKDSAIVSVSLPSLKYLEAGAFKNLSDLTSVSLSEYVETIPASCFENCEYITDFSNYGGVKTVEKNAFKNCMVMKAFDLNNTEVIGKNAFENCYALTEVAISDSAREIGKNAFKGCNGILVFETPFIGKNKEETAKYSFDYFINCDSEKESFTVVLRGMTSIHSKAFEDCSAIVSVDFGDTVTEIQAGAFKNATSLQSITLPEVMSSVAESAFFGCSNLSEVIGIEHVTHIGKSAFEGCSYISAIDLSAVSTIGEAAFKDCYSLKDVGDTTGLTEIGKSAFRGCYNLETLDLSVSSVRVLGDGAFEDCGNLTTVSIPATLTEIPQKTFKNCYNLRTFEFSNSLKVIGKEAFAYSGIENPKFGSALSVIGEGAFKSCGEITNLVIPASLTSMGKDAFKDCYSLRSIEAPFFGTEAGGKSSSNRVFGSNQNVEKIVMNGSGILTKNDVKAFKSTLSTVEITGSVSEIGKGAFKNFRTLDNIKLGSNVKTIAKEAFLGCVDLDELSLEGSGVTTICKKAFYNSGVSKFIAGDALRTIEEGAFANSYIGVLDISAAIHLGEIPKKACYGCENLHDIILPSSISKIGESAFRYCDNLEELTINQVSTIGKSAFKNCDSLRRLTISGSNTIESAAFNNCDSLEILAISNVNTIAKSAFMSCESLDELTISEVNIIESSAFKSCESLSELTINNVKTIEKAAFKYCENLTEVSISGVSVIGDEAFANTALYEFNVPDGCQKLGKNVFKNCRYMRELYVPGTVKEMGKGIFAGCRSLAVLDLPYIGTDKNTAKKISYLGYYKSLTDIVISDATEIAESAFKNCTSLETLTLNEGIKKMGEEAVEGCEELYKVYLPESLKKFEREFPEGTVTYIEKED